MGLKEVKKHMNSVRRDFSDLPLDEASTADNPFEQYANWFDQAVKAGVLDPYAACLSTVDAAGQPSSRMVYIRDIIDESFVFYTNYSSSKGAEISAKNKGALKFFWGELERQIRIKGCLEKVGDQISDAYFNARPRESQLGAWASAQSNELASRQDLMDQLLVVSKKFEGKQVTRPPFWGGYRLIASEIEFWQGRSSRLHDRLLFIKNNESWQRKRLSP